MGDKVEPWREFIEKRALEVHNLNVAYTWVVFYKLVVIFHKLVGQNLQTRCHRFQLQRPDGRPRRTVTPVHRKTRRAVCHNILEFSARVLAT
jgi:hypothetical protein